ncbi:hypothetical protein [Paraburkholderia terricola]|uniref:hypothetical protein n=1 Tax=Paraburkholderia terricola TaxID=169427 RepID=UPI001FD52E76|nr:hypothetical protein [Paraburkholderia terricola]
MRDTHDMHDTHDSKSGQSRNAPGAASDAKPSGTQYVEPSPLGIEPVEQTDVAKQTNPRRSSERPKQTAEVPLGTGEHAEPPGGGGHASHRKS